MISSFIFSKKLISINSFSIGFLFGWSYWSNGFANYLAFSAENCIIEVPFFDLTEYFISIVLGVYLTTSSSIAFQISEQSTSSYKSFFELDFSSSF